MRRVVIVGNAGSGKTHLAGKLAARFDLANIELDRLNWLPGGFNEQRSPDETKAAVEHASLQHRWVIEGVYGWLAAVALPRSDTLIWLSLPEEECVTNLLGRPIKSGEDPASREALFRWCRAYGERENSSSFAGHRHLFEHFPGRRHRLCSRTEIGNFLKTTSERAEG